MVLTTSVISFLRIASWSSPVVTTPHLMARSISTQQPRWVRNNTAFIHFALRFEELSKPLFNAALNNVWKWKLQQYVPYTVCGHFIQKTWEMCFTQSAGDMKCLIHVWFVKWPKNNCMEPENMLLNNVCLFWWHNLTLYPPASPAHHISPRFSQRQLHSMHIQLHSQ